MRKMIPQTIAPPISSRGIVYNRAIPIPCMIDAIV